VNLKSVAHGGKIENTDATGGATGAVTVPADLVVGPNSNGSGNYSFEIVDYEEAKGRIVVLMKVTSLDGDANQNFYIAYGNSGKTTSQENVHGVWSDYILSYRCSEKSGTTVYDSAGNHNGTLSGGHTLRVSGKVAKAIALDGVDGKISVADHADFDVGGAMTLEFCFRTSTEQSGKALIVHDHDDAKWGVYLDAASGDLGAVIETASGATTAATDNADGFYADGAWHVVTVIYDKTLGSQRLKLCVDGAVVAYADGYNEDITAGDDGLSIGYWSEGGEEYAEIDIDEVKLRNTAIDTDRMETEYNNMNNHTADSPFWSQFDEAGGGGAAIAKGVGMSTTGVGGDRV